MRGLMEAGGVVVLRAIERAKRREHDAIKPRDVAGAVAAMTNVGAERRKEGLGACVPFALRFRLGHRVEMRRQALHLRNIEHPEVAQERHSMGRALPGVVRSVLPLVAYGHLLHQHDRRALLALADVATDLGRLAEGEPARERIPSPDRRRPQGQHVDAPIRALGSGVERHALPALAALPGLHPRSHALLKLGHDRSRDLGMDLCAHGTLPALRRRRPMRRRPMPGSPFLALLNHSGRRQQNGRPSYPQWRG